MIEDDSEVTNHTSQAGQAAELLKNHIDRSALAVIPAPDGLILLSEMPGLTKKELFDNLGIRV
jgi:hypothetical protein